MRRKSEIKQVQLLKDEGVWSTMPLFNWLNDAFSQHAEWCSAYLPQQPFPFCTSRVQFNVCVPRCERTTNFPKPDSIIITKFSPLPLLALLFSSTILVETTNTRPLSIIPNESRGDLFFPSFHHNYIIIPQCMSLSKFLLIEMA